MKTYQNVEELRGYLNEFRTQGKDIVLVPTMGALHFGHEKLLKAGRKLAGENGILVASIFLNPIQFDNLGDLAGYPSMPESDLCVCARAGVDVVFLPTPQEMYAPDRSVVVGEDALSAALCGATRPGHFTGVCTIVAKLFNIVQPHHALFGKKDYQQLAIIRRMVRDLNYGVQIHGVETVREPNGLACSSRNERLSTAQRNAAPVIYRALQTAQLACKQGMPLDKVLQETRIMIEQVKGVLAPRIDYLTVVDAHTLMPVPTDAPCPPQHLLIATAVFFDDVRLIDNVELCR